MITLRTAGAFVGIFEFLKDMGAPIPGIPSLDDIGNKDIKLISSFLTIGGGVSSVSTATAIVGGFSSATAGIGALTTMSFGLAFGGGLAIGKGLDYVWGYYTGYSLRRRVADGFCWFEGC